MINLSASDSLQLNELGISEKALLHQYKLLKDGIDPVEIIGASYLNNGILRFNKTQITLFEKKFAEQVQKINVARFVPASGAASRMFKAFFEYLESGFENKEIESFANGFQAFAFYDLIKCTNEANYSCAINNMINTHKLPDLPKALIPFHSYENDSRTALEEHLVEAAMILGEDSTVNIHFTISASYQKKFNSLIEQIINKYTADYNCEYNISFSYQSHATDTIAVDFDNQLARNNDGGLVFRPGGHGSLLTNLNNLSADLIFIKNIDNVQPDHLKDDAVLYKKILAGYLISLQDEIRSLLIQIDNSEIELGAAESFIKNELQIRLPGNFKDIDVEEKIKVLRAKLNRPLRVCGMVKNEGEPGGGPFWIRNSSGNESLQIVESSQINRQNKQQEEILQQSTYFNPVDIVCWIKDYNGNKFDLSEFVDSDTAFITEKSQDGQNLKVLEHPGLWNGAMADWITLFVEVPISSFSPVKTITDLLRPQHQPI